MINSATDCFSRMTGGKSASLFIRAAYGKTATRKTEGFVANIGRNWFAKCLRNNYDQRIQGTVTIQALGRDVSKAATPLRVAHEAY